MEVHNKEQLNTMQSGLLVNCNPKTLHAIFPHHLWLLRIVHTTRITIIHLKSFDSSILQERREMHMTRLGEPIGLHILAQGGLSRDQ